MIPPILWKASLPSIITRSNAEENVSGILRIPSLGVKLGRIMLSLAATPYLFRVTIKISSGMPKHELIRVLNDFRDGLQCIPIF